MLNGTAAERPGRYPSAPERTRGGEQPPGSPPGGRNRPRGRTGRPLPWSCLLDARVHLRLGNRPTAIGRAAALGELGAFLAGLAAIGRGCREVWALEEASWRERVKISVAAGSFKKKIL